jgi:hypothetical protein
MKPGLIGRSVALSEGFMAGYWDGSRALDLERSPSDPSFLTCARIGRVPGQPSHTSAQGPTGEPASTIAFASDRLFIVAAYDASHCQLVLRSYPESPNESNIELVFKS